MKRKLFKLLIKELNELSIEELYDLIENEKNIILELSTEKGKSLKIFLKQE